MIQPLVSIVLCTFNGARFLEEQVESILNQTYPFIELIISDDASTDNTIMILKKYEGHPAVKLFYNKQNVGFSKNFEQTALLCKGSYIAFSDQDDVWLPHKIEALYQSIDKYSLVYSDSKLMDENGNDLHKSLSDIDNLQDVYNSKAFVFFCGVFGHTMMVKKELIENAFPIPLGYSHDWWLAVQATNLDGIRFLNQRLTLYRQHSNSVTKKLREENESTRMRKMPTHTKRYEDFIKDLKWIELLKENKLEKEKSFYNDFYNLFILKKQNHFVWPLFWFLIKHQTELFLFSKRKYLSLLFEIRKRARGEKE